MFAGFDYLSIGCYDKWRRIQHTPILEANCGDCAEAFVLRMQKGYTMLYSGLQDGKMYRAESSDGVKWNIYTIGAGHCYTCLGGERGAVLSSRPDLGWAQKLFSPFILQVGSVYHLWYSAKGVWSGKEMTTIGHAVSRDGSNWTMQEKPVLVPEFSFEEKAVCYPCVSFLPDKRCFEMWYTAGGLDFPACIGWAQSEDGEHWIKKDLPVLFAQEKYERWGIGACDVCRQDGWIYLFYTAWEDSEKARICVSRCREGGTLWERNPQNPVLTGGIGGCWDVDGVAVPRLLRNEEGWSMYYTGRRGSAFSCGVAVRSCVCLNWEDPE